MVRQVVALVELQGAELQDRGDEHDAVQVQAVAVLQVAGEPGGAGGAVALADEELGREPAPVAGGVEPDEVADRLDVLFEAVELLGLLAVTGRL